MNEIREKLDDQDQKNIDPLKNRNIFDIKMKQKMNEDDIRIEMKKINIMITKEKLILILQNMKILDIVLKGIQINTQKVNIAKNTIPVTNTINTIIEKMNEETLIDMMMI